MSPIPGADARAEGAHLHADSAGLRADVELCIGWYSQTDRRGGNRRKQKRLHGVLLCSIALVGQRMTGRGVSMIRESCGVFT